MKTTPRSLLALVALLLSFPVAAQDPKPPEPQEPAKSPGPVVEKGLTPYPLFGSTAQVTSGTAFNPAISVIPEFIYFSDDKAGKSASLLLGAEGFDQSPVGGGRDLSRGFNLGETELAISAVADPYFDATAIFSFAPDGVSVEEAFARTRRLPWGLTLKAGKFYSGIGYANEQHPHQWAFLDQSLPYAFLLGGGVNEPGVQLTWLPKASFYLLFGAEALQGTNAGLSNVVSDPSGALGLPDRAGPRLFTGFVRMSPDIGYDDALQLGAWYAYSSQQQELRDVPPPELLGTPTALDGTAWAAGLDVVFKHDAGRTRGAGSFTLQAEYVFRQKDLAVVSSADPGAVGSTEALRQDGLTVQGVYGFAPRWTVNARWDAVGLVNKVDAGDLAESLRATSRVSAAIVFDPTEFSRLRAQYSYGSVALPGGERQTYSQFALQMQLSLGVHGSHKF